MDDRDLVPGTETAKRTVEAKTYKRCEHTVTQAKKYLKLSLDKKAMIVSALRALTARWKK